MNLKSILHLKKKYYWMLLAAIVVVMIAISTWNVLGPVTVPETIISITKGDSADTIAAKLYKDDIIKSPFWFKVFSRLTHSDRYLKPGRFVFGGDTDLLSTLRKIKDGKSLKLTVTIPEGYSQYKTLKRLERSGIASYQEFVALCSNPVFVQKLTGKPGKSLEGFLYPETYQFDSYVKPDSVLAVMVGEFFKKTAALPLPAVQTPEFYQILTLASIVEKEAVMPDEKPTIASVYWNRLRLPKKLESCPTVDYLLEQRDIHRDYLLYSDLTIQSPYNTYIVEGLPPTPICSPTVSTIKATMNPAKTNYLFFFADRKGRNIFSASYEEHLQKQRQFHKMERIRKAS